jgi:hypothetical protein
MAAKLASMPRLGCGFGTRCECQFVRAIALYDECLDDLTVCFKTDPIG